MKRFLIVVALLLCSLGATAQVTAVGNLTASSTDCSIGAACVPLPVPATGVAVAVQVTGTWTATIQFEGTVDGTNWFSVNAFPITSSTAVTSATATGNWQINAAGFSQVRVRCSAFTSGTVVVNIRAATGAGANSGAVVSGSVTAVQPTGTNLHTVLDTTSTTAVTSSDPCLGAAKTYVPISLTVNTKLVTGVSAKKVYICSINIVAGAATNIAIVEGTGSVCGTGTAGVFGGATAATGWNFAANGGIAHGVGLGTVGVSATAADDVCIFVSAANQVSGGISVVIQ